MPAYGSMIFREVPIHIKGWIFLRVQRSGVSNITPLEERDDSDYIFHLPDKTSYTPLTNSVRKSVTGHRWER